MEGKFFIEIGVSGPMETEAQDEGDSDDEEETRKFHRNPSSDGNDDTGSEKENSPQLHDSGIDSFLLPETGTPASEENDDDDGDQAFRPVVYSKKRRGSRGREARPDSNGSSDSNAASESVTLASELNLSDATPETNKQKKRRKRKKKPATETPTNGPSNSEWDQLDIVDEDFGKSEDRDLGKLDGPIEDIEPDVTKEGEEEMAISPEQRRKKVSLAVQLEAKESVKNKDEVFVLGKLPNGSHERSVSESYDSKSGIKSILKNARSRNFSGESSCSDAVELGSSCGGRSGSGRSRNQSTASLTDVTQSMESLSITSMLTSDSCCDEGQEDKCGNSPHFASSWSASGTRKSVHFSAVIDRKRFRSGAPPVNVGKGRRCSTGKANVNQREHHGKKRHMSEGDAGSGTALSPKDLKSGGDEAVKVGDASDVRGDSPNESMFASFDDLFEMEELNEEDVEDFGKKDAMINGSGSLLVNVPEEVEDQEVTSENKNRSETKPKKGKKNKKRGKGKGSNPEVTPDIEYDEIPEGWSIVGCGKLGWKKAGSKNSSDLSLSSDVDDGHSIYAKEGASDFGAISITNG